ncbi:MAG: hypothetical protein ACE3JK_02625 [Sporolactobacillus sp.]
MTVILPPHVPALPVLLGIRFSSLIFSPFTADEAALDAALFHAAETPESSDVSVIFCKVPQEVP